MLNINFTSIMPDSILTPYHREFDIETHAFPIAVESLKGLQGAAAGWMNLRNYANWGQHQCWWLTQELTKGRGANVPQLIGAWDMNLLANRFETTHHLISTLHETEETHRTLFHAAALSFDDRDAYHRILDVNHLSAFHTGFYNTYLSLIEGHIKELGAWLRTASEAAGYTIAIRHPAVTPNQCHTELMTQDGDNLIRLSYKIPALKSKTYRHLWELCDVQDFDGIPHPLLFEEGSFGQESNRFHEVYNSWMRFNGYATVVNTANPDAPYGVIYADTIHPSLLHSTVNMVSVPIYRRLRSLGIHDIAGIYQPVVKGGKQPVISGSDVPTFLIQLTNAVALYCQLLTAFSNGKKGAPGTPKTRWSASPANIAWGRTLLAITPGLIAGITK